MKQASLNMFRIHFMPQCFTLSDPCLQAVIFDTPLCPEFAQLKEFSRLPEEHLILRFRHCLEKNGLAEKILRVIDKLLGAKDTEIFGNLVHQGIEKRPAGYV